MAPKSKFIYYKIVNRLLKLEEIPVGCWVWRKPIGRRKDMEQILLCSIAHPFFGYGSGGLWMDNYHA